MTRPRGTGRRLIAVTVATMLLVGGLSFPARASTEASVALGLASFAVFNQLFWPILAPRVVYYPPPYYYYYYPSYPSVGYPPPTGAYPYSVPTPAPVPTAPTVIYYPHGRHELRGDGVTTAYYWVWIPNPPPPPAPSSPVAPSTPQPGNP